MTHTKASLAILLRESRERVTRCEEMIAELSRAVQSWQNALWHYKPCDKCKAQIERGVKRKMRELYRSVGGGK